MSPVFGRGMPAEISGVTVTVVLFIHWKRMSILHMNRIKTVCSAAIVWCLAMGLAACGDAGQPDGQVQESSAETIRETMSESASESASESGGLTAQDDMDDPQSRVEERLPAADSAAFTPDENRLKPP